MRPSVPILPLRSRITTDGIDRAPHRAFMRGMGLDDAAIARPFIGVVTTAGDTTPCNGTLAEQAAHAQEGVVAGGGTPRVHDHFRLRRHQHEPPGHEMLAGVARGDRRFDRAGDARPCL
jgi:hypothetical protein